MEGGGEEEVGGAGGVGSRGNGRGERGQVLRQLDGEEGGGVEVAFGGGDQAMGGTAKASGNRAGGAFAGDAVGEHAAVDVGQGGHAALEVVGEGAGLAVQLNGLSPDVPTTHQFFLCLRFFLIFHRHKYEQRIPHLFLTVFAKEDF